jgi:hypothetical protein
MLYQSYARNMAMQEFIVGLSEQLSAEWKNARPTE